MSTFIFLKNCGVHPRPDPPDPFYAPRDLPPDFDILAAIHAEFARVYTRSHQP